MDRRAALREALRASPPMGTVDDLDDGFPLRWVVVPALLALLLLGFVAYLFVSHM